MKLKFAAWMLIMSGVLGLGLTAFIAYMLPMPFMGAIISSVMAIIPLGIGFYVLKQKRWALSMGLIYFVIQLMWIKSESFSWKFEFSSPISLFMSITVAEVEVGVNFVAIAMCIVFIQLLRSKENEKL